MSNAIVWFREDLRLQQHAALESAVAAGFNVLPVFLLPQGKGTQVPGEASRWWLHYSLQAHSEAIAKQGGTLWMAATHDRVELLLELCHTQKITQVYAHRVADPDGRKEEERLHTALQVKQGTLHLFEGNWLLQPEALLNGQGEPYKVFTPFYKSALVRFEKNTGESLKTKSTLQSIAWNKDQLAKPWHTKVEPLKLLPKINWTQGFGDCGQPGEVNAQLALRHACKRIDGKYKSQRDFPSLEGVSRLSPRLRWGELSPQQILMASRDADFTRQIWWREFARYLVVHFPHTASEPFHQNFQAFPWKSAPRLLDAWQRGRTGYPLVDAGMRQLWTSGWMHNRVRMVVASFLTKDLLIPWQKGQDWFYKTLLDEDPANNAFGWQWSAGCGADGAPFFRIFHPITQSRKFDPDGTYIRRWVPELAKLDNASIHAPWEATPMELAAAGIELGRTYPLPIVDHAEARVAALAAYRRIKTDPLRDILA